MPDSTADDPLKLTVILPTYRRPADFDRCLRGLADQTRQPDQIVIVVRTDDVSSTEVIARWCERLPIDVCTIYVPGVVAALNLGLEHATGDLISMTDDDACPSSDWLERIEQHFVGDPKLGGLGGRDIVHHATGEIEPPATDRVGLIHWCGRLIGNHHIGYGPAREVHHIKGVNMSFRASAIAGKRFDPSLRGTGAQVYCELAFSLEMIGRGWRLIYDPSVFVDHFPARRWDVDTRVNPSLEANENAAFNLFLSLRRYLPPGRRRFAALTWARWVGASGYPGILRNVRYRIFGNTHGLKLHQAALRAWNDATIECGEQVTRIEPKFAK